LSLRGTELCHHAAAAHSDAGALVEREFGVDQIAVVLQQPADADGVAVEDLLVGLQHQDDVAVGLVAFLAVPNHVGDEYSRHELVVDGATAVEIEVLLGQLERIDRPVLAPRLNDIDMGEQHDRLAGAGAAQSRHQVAFARHRREHLQVWSAEPGAAQARGHPSAAWAVSPVAVTVLISISSL
jgi:hypothetical protein